MTRTELADLQHALASVWSGADHLDAEAVADHLEDLGWVGLLPRPPRVRDEEPLPLERVRVNLPRLRG